MPGMAAALFGAQLAGGKVQLVMENRDILGAEFVEISRRAQDVYKRQDRLFDFPVTGHYRIGAAALARLQELGR